MVFSMLSSRDRDWETQLLFLRPEVAEEVETLLLRSLFQVKLTLQALLYLLGED